MFETSRTSVTKKERGSRKTEENNQRINDALTNKENLGGKQDVYKSI